MANGCEQRVCTAPCVQNTDGGTSAVRLGRCVCVCGDKRMIWKYDVLGGLGCLADERGLLQGDEDRAHAGHVLGLLAGLGVEVAEPGHALPLRAGVGLVQI